MTKPRLNMTPQKKVNLDKLDDFASGVEKDPKGATTKDEVKPWEEKGVNEKVIVPFNLRPNQVQSLKLKYIVAKSAKYKSVHEFCIETIMGKVEEKLKELLS